MSVIVVPAYPFRAKQREAARTIRVAGDSIGVAEVISKHLLTAGSLSTGPVALAPTR
jgi:hypothetical protein